MDTTELLKKVRKLEIKTKDLTKHIFSGEYHSAFKGRGMAFSEVRDYHYGDDVRNIDWNVTARTGSPHIKVFDEERELTVMLLIDVSASVYFGTTTAYKSEIITEIAAVLSFSALTNNDKVGAILFSDHIEKYLPPKKGKQNILRLIRELIHFTPSQQKTDISEALMFLNNTQKKRSITFLMSDFMADNYGQALTIAAKKHDIIGLKIYDQREQTLPDAGLINVIDEETGKMRIMDTSNPYMRAAYAKHFLATTENFSKNFASAKSDTIVISTDDDYIKALQVFFKRRAKR